MHTLDHYVVLYSTDQNDGGFNNGGKLSVVGNFRKRQNIRLCRLNVTRVFFRFKPYHEEGVVGRGRALKLILHDSCSKTSFRNSQSDRTHDIVTFMINYSFILFIYFNYFIVNY